MTNNPLVDMSRPAPVVKDGARKVEEKFIQTMQGYAMAHDVVIRVENTSKNPDGSNYNRYVIPTMSGAELAVEFRNFTVNELSNIVRKAQLHSVGNEVMISSIMMTGERQLNQILNRMNLIIREIFSRNAHCYYVVQNVRHLEHLFFYHDRHDESMVVVRFKTA